MLEEIAATPIRDMSLREPARAAPEATLIDVVTKMRELRRGATIIEDAQGKLIGIFTERDLMLRVDHTDLSWHGRTVGEVMTKELTAVADGEPLSVALRKMKEGAFRHLPVTDVGGSAVGIVSIRDILSHIVEHFPDEFINLPSDPEHEARRRWGG